MCLPPLLLGGGVSGPFLFKGFPSFCIGATTKFNDHSRKGCPHKTSVLCQNGSMGKQNSLLSVVTKSFFNDSFHLVTKTET